MLVNISRNKGNQTMKSGHLIEYPKKNIFRKNYSDNEAEKLVSVHFLFFKKAIYYVKS